jgi:hypothetical protein
LSNVADECSASIPVALCCMVFSGRQNVGETLMFWYAPQSDIVHQSVYELVHSEDREELQRQLMWNSFLPPESANFVLHDILQPDNCHLLERSFTVRFRCLLDNTSGFLVSPPSRLLRLISSPSAPAQSSPPSQTYIAFCSSSAPSCQLLVTFLNLIFEALFAPCFLTN